jgi:thymidylate synthase ThyX
MVNAACATWTRELNKWDKLSPQGRFEIVKRVLEKKALPLAAEFPRFSFEIENVSRKVFDQAVRSRIASYSSAGSKDNFMNDCDFIIPTRILKNKEATKLVKELFDKTKSTYMTLQQMGLPNWCLAHLLPLGYSHRYMFSMDFLSLQQFLSKRMETTEEEGIVLLSWKIWDEIYKISPLLANYLRPASDWVKKDLNLSFNGFSSEIGIPHISDLRWATEEELRKQNSISINNEPCTDINAIEKALGHSIRSPSEWKDYTWETLDEKDKKLFECS